MVFRVKDPTNFGAGLLFILIGVAGVYFGRDLEYGSALQMGPGFFPTWLSWIILIVGVGVALRSLTLDGPPIEVPQIRPIFFIIGAILIFGFLITKSGLAISTAVLAIVAAFARQRVNLKETIIFGVLLGIGATVVFVYGLGQPMPAWWGG